MGCHTAVICLGASAATKLAAVDAAFGFIAAAGRIKADSGGFPSEPERIQGETLSYHNRVAILETTMDFESLRNLTKNYENGVRKAFRGPGVAVDIDIVLFDGEVLRPADAASAYFRRGMELACQNMVPVLSTT